MLGRKPADDHDGDDDDDEQEEVEKISQRGKRQGACLMLMMAITIMTTVTNIDDRLGICRDRRWCKIFVSCVYIFPENNTVSYMFYKFTRT